MSKKKKLALIITASILVLLLSVLLFLNLAKPLIYPTYFSIKTDICENPGLSDGFVCQGIAASEENGKIFVSGYMKNHSASRIYVTDYESNSFYVSLSKNGEVFSEHAGGIAISGNKFYIASQNRIYPLSVSAFLNAKNGDIVEIGEGIEVNNAASFAFANEDYLYIGEFHDGNKYVTNHPFTTDDGDYYAIMCRYSHDDLTKPNKVYSIRNKVQGVCFTDDGRIVLSTSYGLTSSVYYIYDESKTVDSGLTLDGAPVYYLSEYDYEFKGPAMSEGLDFSNGKVLTLSECASNKYIFGKFFFANKIVSLELK